jgi:hypothetical protein
MQRCAWQTTATCCTARVMHQWHAGKTTLSTANFVVAPFLTVVFPWKRTSVCTTSTCITTATHFHAEDPEAKGARHSHSFTAHLVMLQPRAGGSC